MGDQAEALRRLTENRVPSPGTAPVRPQFSSARVIAIASGKGGVGKTNVVVNLGTMLARRGQRVLILDADLGLANVDLLLGIAPPHTLWHAIHGQLPLSDVIFQAKDKLQVLAGASGVDGLADMPASQRELLVKRLSYLEEQYDFLIIDCGAGVGHNVLGFASAADEVLLVCTPEPTAVMDVYGLIKLIHKRGGAPQMTLVMNQVERSQEGFNAAESIRDVSLRFLGIELTRMHFVPKDPLVSQAVRRQQPLVDLFPGSPASKAIGELATQLIGEDELVPRMGFFQRVGKMLWKPGDDQK